LKATLNPEARHSIHNKYGAQSAAFSAEWTSPSNIALIKYWGKKAVQLPMNPSISMTLSRATSKTSIQAVPGNQGKLSFEFYYDGQPKPAFEPKLEKFFQHLPDGFEFLNDFHLVIDSVNTFPHSTGIASSASAMSALALCLCDLRQQINANFSGPIFQETASTLARIGSGSASRSIYGNFVNWGHSADLPGSSDFFGTPIGTIHPNFKNLQDSILIVSDEEKAVSSTVGHQLMKGHPFANQRFAQAKTHHNQLLAALEQGDYERFIQISEAEALSLHAMMMTSDPYFILMQPATLLILQEIRTFRETSKVPVCFTLDAGPNVHLIYPEHVSKQVNSELIDQRLRLKLNTLTILHDQIGKGPEKLN
jgi:diphosphomevalonate decarboxylase